MLLIAILLPSLQRARAQGRVVVCESNLRQIVQAATFYEGAEGALPASFTHQWAPKSLRGVNEACAVWPGQVRSYAGGVGSEGIFYCPEAPESSRWVPTFGSNNPARYGYGEGELYPSGSFPNGNTYGHNNNGTRTHAFSGTCNGPSQKAFLFLGLSDDPDPGGSHFFQVSMVCVWRPSQFICFGDSLLDGTWDAFIDYQVMGEDIAHRHQGGANLALLDGHVMYVPDPETYEDNTGAIGIDPAKGQMWNNDGIYP
jgi:prepilin-type processing-associated H-X9-DG protein